MDAKRIVALLTVGFVSLLLCGCGLVSAGRTCDQGCSNPVQAAAKIAGNNLGSLNADDVQVLADLATQVSGAAIPSVTNEQAAAVISFLQANGINTIADLQALIAQIEADPTSVEIPDDVLAVIQAIAADPDAYIEAAEELGL